MTSMKTYFCRIPTIGFKNNKNLREHLVRVVIPELDEESRSKTCGGKRSPCQLGSDHKSFHRSF